MALVKEFGDEDTEVRPEVEMVAPKKGAKSPGAEPSYELVWVEEPGMGMVLRVRPVTAKN
jgi:hypothetical protein